jgi:uncharacterized protein (TIGR01777 family)
MKDMHILISGGSGLIGSALAIKLLENQHRVTVLTRNPEKTIKQFKQQFANKNKQLDLLSVIRTPEQLSKKSAPTHFIALSGAGIADKRWSTSRKQALISSRLAPSTAVISWLEQHKLRLEAVIIGAAVGIYPYNSLGQESYKESDEIEIDEGNFAQLLCRKIESQDKAFKKVAKQVTSIRTGVVLSPQGGALAKMRIPTSLCLNGKIGSGEQPMAWIHLADTVSAIMHLLKASDLATSYNLVAPQAISNKTLSESMSRHLNRPFQLPVPAASLKLLLGDASELLTKGQNVTPFNLINEGFEFEFSDLDSALQNCLAD